MNDTFLIKYEVSGDFGPSDYDKINQMIISTWDYRSWLPKEMVEPVAEYFLSEFVLTSSRIYVARDGEEIVGVIALSLMDNIRQKANAKVMKYKALKTIISAQGKEVFDLYLDTLILNERLLLNSGKCYDAALNLFILDERYRGMGIGSNLYSLFNEYLAERKVDEYFLWTDNSSNYQFYERKGLKRIAEEKYSWGGSDDDEYYYLYEGKTYLHSKK